MMEGGRTRDIGGSRETEQLQTGVRLELESLLICISEGNEGATIAIALYRILLADGGVRVVFSVHRSINEDFEGRVGSICSRLLGHLAVKG